jgi:hypothetical protein
VHQPSELSGAEHHLEQFYDRLRNALRQPLYARAGGNCSSACRPGKVTGPWIVSWPAPGKVATANDEYLKAAHTFASNNDLGMAIAEFDLTNRPACGVKLAENGSGSD